MTNFYRKNVNKLYNKISEHAGFFILIYRLNNVCKVEIPNKETFLLPNKRYKLLSTHMT
jgi:hypothetical protein